MSNKDTWFQPLTSAGTHIQMYTAHFNTHIHTHELPAPTQMLNNEKCLQDLHLVLQM